MLRAKIPAFQLHVDDLARTYGALVLVNLIDKDNDEWGVGEPFEKLVRSVKTPPLKFETCAPISDPPSARYIHFDFHRRVGRGYERLPSLLDDFTDDMSAHSLNLTNNAQKCRYFLSVRGSIEQKQRGVVRSNCIDCLDRTNVAQVNKRLNFPSFFSRAPVCHRQLCHAQDDRATHRRRRVPPLPCGGAEARSPPPPPPLLPVWANNGDSLSIQYSGTGSLKNDFTRSPPPPLAGSRRRRTGKRSLEGIMNDGVKSLRRFYLSRFRDENRQDAIDLFLGNFVVDPRDYGTLV
jgi:hypothetical protein